MRARVRACVLACVRAASACCASDRGLLRVCQEAGNIKQLRSAFETSATAPYSHCVLENFCDEARLRAVHDEAKF